MRFLTVLLFGGLLCAQQVVYNPMTRKLDFTGGTLTGGNVVSFSASQYWYVPAATHGLGSCNFAYEAYLDDGVTRRMGRPQVDCNPNASNATINGQTVGQYGILLSWSAPETGGVVIVPAVGTGGGGAVSSVFTRTGAVVAASGDYTATQITNTPAGSIAAVTVQAALNEVDAEKQPSDADLIAFAALACADGQIAKRVAGVWACANDDTAAAGTGDASTNTSISVDSEIALFSGTAGKTLKRATGTGVAKITSGVLGVVAGLGTDCVRVDGTSSACASGSVSSVTAGAGITNTGTSTAPVLVSQSCPGCQITWADIQGHSPSAVQNIAAVTDVPLCNAVHVQLSANAAYTLDPAAANPIIADGSLSGQVCVIINTGLNAITFTDEDVMVGSNLELKTTTVSLGTKSSLTLIWNLALAAWVQI